MLCVKEEVYRTHAQGVPIIDTGYSHSRYSFDFHG